MSESATGRRTTLRFGLLAGCLITSLSALGAPGYKPIQPTMVDKTITLTGKNLTVEQLVDIARYGAKVQLAPEAKQREADNYGVLLEASAEGIPVYWFNRGAGDQRETVLFEGDPLSAKNKAYLEKTQLMEFKLGATWGYGPEVSEEEIVRAMMAVRANAMTWNAPSPQLAQMLLDLLNHRVTPVVQSRGTLGEGDLAELANLGGTMVGAGEAYYQGARMSAAEALSKAGLKPIQPFAADTNALTSSDAYATGIAGLAVADAHRALDWADLILAMDLNGMNSSITPLSTLVQRERPFQWLNWDAMRLRELLKGSYLFNEDPHRIIQDPESLRASSIRQASAWEEWGALRDAVVTQMNSSDHNPAVRADLSPQDAWDLASGQMMKYHVKGGKNSNGKSGYIVSNANWDPFPMANKMENFIIALANMDVAVSLRIDRFTSPFFTQTDPAKVLNMAPGSEFLIYLAAGGGYTPVDLQQEMQSLTNPVAPSGAAIDLTVEDLQAQTRIKAYRVRQAVDVTFDLLGHDLLNATFWMEVRKKQDASRSFGDGPTRAMAAFRKVMPFMPDFEKGPAQIRPMVSTEFIKETAASTFYPSGDKMQPPAGTP